MSNIVDPAARIVLDELRSSNALNKAAADEIVRLRLELAEARRALELSRSNAVFYKDGVLIAAFDQYGRQIHAHKVITL